MKLLTFFSTLLLVGGILGGASLLSAHNKSEQAEATISTSYEIGTALKFANTSADTNSVPYTSLTIGGWGNSSASISGRTVTITEDTPSKYFGCVYIPITHTVTIPAYTRYSEPFSSQLEVKKEATGGSAGFYAEIFKYGMSESHPTTLNTAANDTASDSNYSIYRLAGTSAGTLQKLNISYTLTMDNQSGSQIVKTFYFGLFAGIRYASSYNHQLTATFNFCQTTIAETSYQAIISSTGYESLTDAVSVFNDGSGLSLKLCRNISYNGGLTFAADGTILLNTFTLTINSLYSLAISGSVATSGSGTIAGKIIIQSGGKFTLGSNGIATSAENTITVKSGGTLFNLGSIKMTSSLTGYQAVTNSGTACFGTGNVIATNGKAISCAASSKTYFYASASIIGKVASVGPTSLIYGSYNSSYYTGSGSITIVSSNYAVGDVVVYSANTTYYSKFILSQDGLNTTLSSGNVVAIYATYSVTINGSHFTHNSVSSVSMASDYTVTLTPDTGYQIVSKTQINMTIGEVNTSVFSYNSSSGLLTLSASYISGNIIIDVTTSIKTYVLRYIANNGTSDYNETSENHGSTVYVSDNSFTKSGYEFAHWNTNNDDSGTSYAPDDTFVITSLTFLYAIWVEEGAPTAVSNFITNYMHMDDVSYSGNGTGLCISNGTYASAKVAFNALSSAARELFVSDASYLAAKNRLVAWATANGEQLNASNSLVAASGNHVGLASNNIELYIVLTLVSLMGISFILIYGLKKKKRSHE